MFCFRYANRASFLLSHHVEPPKYQLLIPVSSPFVPLGIIKRSQKSPYDCLLCECDDVAAQTGCFFPGREPRKTFVDNLPCRSIPFRSVSYAVVPDNHPSFPISFEAVESLLNKECLIVT